MMNFYVLYFECRRIDSEGREGPKSIHRALSVAFLSGADLELGHVILPSSCGPENLQPSTY